jgi:NAD(P)-dependent dehydrogenase (short-subunit alcohol dehydrogenase family)
LVNALANKVALITGGSNGIGRAAVRRFVDEGATTCFLDLDSDAGEVVARRTGGRFYRCDITIEADVAAAVGDVIGRHERIDVLVNNAGINAYYDAVAMTPEQWDEVFAVDLKAAWLCAKYVLPSMRSARGGSIVNIASIHAFLTTDGMFPYASAKAAVVGMTKSLALDEAVHGIRVNAVCPGWVRTRLVEEWIERQPDPAEAEQRVLDAHPLGRIGTPEEIAALIAFVASEDASYITGAALLIDGGLSARYAV